MSTRSNIAAVARREYTVRLGTRSFMFGTLLLVIGVVVIALLPVIVRYIDQTDATNVAVVTTAEDLAADPVATLTTVLNTPPTAGTEASAKPNFIVTAIDDVTAGRADVVAGRYAALLEITRVPGGELDFTLYTNDSATGRAAALGRQAANAIALADRLDRLGVEAADQATLFAPATFDVSWPDPERTDPTRGTMETVGQDMLAFGMTILIFMMIIMYGTWIAMSVVEEKSSRVMEVVLNAATPFQLLAGKVFGVGAVAFTQYGAVVVAGGLALMAQGLVASLVLGDAATTALPEGLTLGLLLLFGVYGVLGFLVYSCLYAAAGSLISRQEDVNAIVMPMTLISTGGYLVGVYAAMGLLDIRAGWITVLTQVPFVSPFMMLGRIATGIAEPWEIVLSISLLVVTIAGSLWLAARIYAAGVLLYGQRPGVRAVWRLVRQGV
jgi:ABC-2 type transport system permease protein